MGTIDLLHVGIGLLSIMLVLVMLLLPASKSKVCDDCGLERKAGDHPHEITGCPTPNPAYETATHEYRDGALVPRLCRHQVPLDKFCPSCADDLHAGPGATICGGKPPF